jgi:hypothetical protein
LSQEFIEEGLNIKEKDIEKQVTQDEELDNTHRPTAMRGFKRTTAVKAEVCPYID